MAIEVKLPNLGDGIDTGDVLELLVKEGDTIAKDQGLIELETGKATLQVPSSAAGKISKIHVKPGQTIPPGTLLVTLEGTEAAGKAAAEKPAAGAVKETKEKGEKKQETGDRSQESGVRSQQPKETARPAPAKTGENPKSNVQSPKLAAAQASSPNPQAPLPEPTHDGGVP